MTTLDGEWEELYNDYGTLLDNYTSSLLDLDTAQDAYNGDTATFNEYHADFVAEQELYTDLVADYDAANKLSGEKEATLVSYEDRTVAPKCLFGVMGWYMYCREFDEIDSEAAAEDDEDDEEEEVEEEE
jgi:hypothetical protein